MDGQTVSEASAEHSGSGSDYDYHALLLYYGITMNSDNIIVDISIMTNVNNKVQIIH